MKRLILLLACLIPANMAFTKDSHKILKVGGNFEVSSIDLVDSGTFRVEFTAQKATGRLDTLVLETDHVHFSIKEGQVIRLSAEVLSENNDTAEIAQVLLFLPSAQGPTPVWMLSKKGSQYDLRAAKYLDMHAPVNDYVVF